MEEVDKIIIVTLKQIGCEIPSDVSSLKEFTVEMIVKAVALGLGAIRSDKNFDGKLPQEMSARYRVCSAIAKACTELGYRGEIGYHQFLYPSESETRRIFMWLVEAIPKMEKSQEQESVGSDALFQRTVGGEVAERSKQSWVPSFCLKQGVYRDPKTHSWHFRGRKSHHDFYSSSVTVPLGASDLSVKLSKDEKRYQEKILPFVSQQPSNRKEVAPSLLSFNNQQVVAHMEWEQEWSKHGLSSGLSQEEYKNRKKQKIMSRFSEQMKAASQRAAREEGESLEKLVDAYGKGVTFSSRFSNQAKFAETETNMGETEESLQKKREEEINNLRERVSALTVSVSKMEGEMQSYSTNIKQLEGKLQEEQAKTKDLEAVYKIQKRTYDLLDDPDNNIARLKREIDDSSKKMLELAAQWEAKRVPLVDAYRTLREKKANRLAESRNQLQKIKEFREQMKELADEARSKNEFHKQLLDEYERLPKDVQRSQYTERIMEIVKNIQKQNIEISKVLLDTRQIQKEISSTIDQLQRTYTASDELIYKDAKTNEFSKKSYRLLVAIHETCGKISDATEETGQIINTSKDLEDKINQLVTDGTTTKLQKILADCEQVRNENKELVQKIKRQNLGV